MNMLLDLNARREKKVLAGEDERILAAGLVCHFGSKIFIDLADFQKQTIQ